MNTTAAAESAVNAIAAQDGLAAEQDASAVTGRYCACNCGDQMAKSSNATFAMGHDAKFKSKAIRLVINPLDEENFDAPLVLLHEPTLNQTEETLADSEITVEEFLDVKSVIERRKLAVELVARQMGRPALAEKIEAGVNNWIARQSGEKRDRSGKGGKKATGGRGGKVQTWTEGTVKVGRWEYPARRNDEFGQVEYRTAKGEMVMAMAGNKVAEAFKPKED